MLIMYGLTDTVGQTGAVAPRDMIKINYHTNGSKFQAPNFQFLSKMAPSKNELC